MTDFRNGISQQPEYLAFNVINVVVLKFMQICMVLLCTFFTVDELVLYFPVLHVTFGTMRLRVRKASQLRSATPVRPDCQDQEEALRGGTHFALRRRQDAETRHRHFLHHQTVHQRQCCQG